MSHPDDQRIDHHAAVPNGPLCQFSCTGRLFHGTGLMFQDWCQDISDVWQEEINFSKLAFSMLVLFMPSEVKEFLLQRFNPEDICHIQLKRLSKAHMSQR